LYFFFYQYPHTTPHLHSFPTRRSSDLPSFARRGICPPGFIHSFLAQGLRPGLPPLRGLQTWADDNVRVVRDNAQPQEQTAATVRSEERRVGKERKARSARGRRKNKREG